ncbi:hypothetical protein FG386_000482 [Cryptosporidium ryanae]|uniref:uncharacterized protein n=1 Tax=Cryptosporidium ryanae TaxID=515981 RepID=UPI00351A762F|nr:hypothetical protein FG386_000482 [Cryptosporidium ryanae]
MIDLENGIIDMVKRIDNVTIKLTDLFFKLENELMELYSLSNSDSYGGPQEKKHDFGGRIKSEFGERMKRLLKEGLISGSEYSEEDDLLITLDNSVMSLESLTSAVLGARFYTDCSFIVGEETAEKKASLDCDHTKFERTEGTCSFENGESESKGAARTGLDGDNSKCNTRVEDTDTSTDVCGEKRELSFLKRKPNASSGFRKGDRQNRVNKFLISDCCDSLEAANSYICAREFGLSLQERRRKGSSVYGKTEINENSVLVSLCRNIKRLTKHRLEIEKYDSNINKELEKIGRERYRELEERLIETLNKLKEKEVKCYEYEKKINSSSYEEKIYEYDGLIGVKSSDGEGGTRLRDDKNKDEIIAETAFQSPRIDSNDHLSLSDCEKNRVLSAKSKQEEENDAGCAFCEYKNAKVFDEGADFANEWASDDDKQNREIIELKDQVQILTMDVLTLAEENERLKSIIAQTNSKSENNTNSGHKQELTEFCNLSDEAIRGNKGEVLFDILNGENFNGEGDVCDEKSGHFDVVFDENEPKKSDLKVVRQSDITITCIEKGNDAVCAFEKKNSSEHQVIKGSTTPYLVMWEPIIDSISHNDDNVLPISISSYRQFKSSRTKKKSVKDVKYLFSDDVNSYGGEMSETGGQVEANGEEASTTGNADGHSDKKGSGYRKVNARIKIDRNSFYCNIEKIIRKNTSQ